MSEDKTQDIGAKYDTGPTIETLARMIADSRDETRKGFAAVEKWFDKVAVRLDRIEAEVKQTHSEFYTLRADFNELRISLKEHFPVIH
ncbi:MAG: hypothetical protein M3430_21905 [Acidobacteriota bacterium]|nr:hypothetical protein [Acidobacteriota bacterium]